MAQIAAEPTKKVWDSVKLYTVRCEKCSKWRLIPSKEKYEEIRETFKHNSFTCARAREWRPQISCEDPTDVTEQDDRLRWAMDRPNIPKTPPGWQRVLRMRAQGGTKFADVYYVAPSNKRMRSMIELDRFFDKHPEFSQGGIDTSRFSFQGPVPLDENYVTKRRCRASAASCSHSKSTVPSQVNPYLWVVPFKDPESVSNEDPAPAES